MQAYMSYIVSFQGFESKWNQGFRKCEKTVRNWYGEKYMQAYMSYIVRGNMHSQDILKCTNFVYYEYKVNM